MAQAKGVHLSNDSVEFAAEVPQSTPTTANWSVTPAGQVGVYFSLNGMNREWSGSKEMWSVRYSVSTY